MRIAIVYAIFGALWILCSDVLVDAIFSRELIQRFRIHTVKGWAFVGVTSVMLYVLVRSTVTIVRSSERALREVEERSRLLIERVRDYAIFTLDAEGNVASWNRGAKQITDWSEDEIRGRHYSVFYRSADVQSGKPQKDLQQAAERGWQEEEGPRVRQDGSEFRAAAMLTALRNEAGNVSGYLALIRDITERQRTEDALRQTGATLSAMFDASPLAIVTVDNEGNVRSWNAAAEQLFGWTAGEAIGKPLQIVPEDRKLLLAENNRRLTRGERLGAMEVVGIRKDRRLVDVAFWAAPLTDQSGKIVGNIRLYADIAKQKRAEEDIRALNESLEARVRERTARVEEANEELQAFSYTVSHDLRIPLRSLQQLASDLLATQQDRLDDTGKADALRIVGAAARMERQIEDLLEYSRVSRSELKLEPVSLVLTVHELLGRLQRDPAFRDAELSVQEPLGWVLAHRLTLQQLILNLLVNAITFVRPGSRPTVHIRATEHAGKITLCIEDNGIGIAEQDRERIFHVFERLPAADRYPGLGVGLTVARRGVQRMGGKITLEKAHTGGTVFCIELPQANASRATQPEMKH